MATLHSERNPSWLTEYCVRISAAHFVKFDFDVTPNSFHFSAKNLCVSFNAFMMGPSLSQRRALISFVALVARATSAADSNGAWLYPDPSIVPTFNYLDTLNASWTSDFSTPWLHLWCGITNADSSSPALGERMTESTLFLT